MCGIVGLWQHDGAAPDPVEFERFTDMLSHRGPNGRGMFHDRTNGLALGHRRLAILDLTEAGKQPMSYAGGRYWITYNGEIYNFLELRETLEGLGHVFRTQTDTEVILAAFAQWGPECQLKFNGMWAFALWDRDRRQLFLSRDRFGIKPLFYYWDGKRFAFASEMKAFLALPWFDLRFDLETVALAVTQPWNVEGMEYTLLTGVRRLPGGYCMQVAVTCEPCIRRWWNTLDHLVTPPARYADQVAEYRRLFFDACRIRMRSDVPMGSSLSGGLDSSSVLCAMTAVREREQGGDRLAADWQRAFVAMYPGTEQDETDFAREVVEKTGARPFYLRIEPDAIVDLMDVITFHCEEISDVHVGAWQVYREQRRNNVVVTMEGHGGDEALAGYGYHVRDAMRAALTPVPHPLKLVALHRTLEAMYLPSARASVPSYADLFRQHVVAPALARARRAYRWLRRRPDAVPAAPGGSWLRVAPRPARFAILEEERDRLRGRSALFRLLYRDFHCVSLPTNLRDFDRLSMAHGVEVRCPFCDWRLVTYTFSLPESSLLGGGYTKRILREAMRGVLPERIRVRRLKTGFANPLKEWLFGPLRGFVLDTLRSEAFRGSPVWKGDAIARAVERAYEREDYGLVGGAWNYVLAINVMRLLRKGPAP